MSLNVCIVGAGTMGAGIAQDLCPSWLVHRVA